MEHVAKSSEHALHDEQEEDTFNVVNIKVSPIKEEISEQQLTPIKGKELVYEQAKDPSPSATPLKVAATVTKVIGSPASAAKARAQSNSKAVAQQLSKLSVAKTDLMKPSVPDNIAKFEERAKSIRKERKDKILSAKRARYKNETKPLAGVLPVGEPEDKP